MTNFLEIQKEYKNSNDFKINDIDIELPHYVKRSISKYRFAVIDDTIYLQRKCNICNEFFNVQIFKDSKFENIKDDIQVRFIGLKSGFHNTCINCENNNKSCNSIINAPTNNLVQFNIKIDSNMKKYYQILCINNGTNLKDEINTALLFYKNYLENNKTYHN